MKTRVTKARKSGRSAPKRQTANAIRPAAKLSRARPTALAPVLTGRSASDQKRPTGKLGDVLGAVAAKHGASLEELVELTGWQPHTARAALTRLRQRGFAVGLRQADGRKAYHLVEAAPR